LTSATLPRYHGHVNSLGHDNYHGRGNTVANHSFNPAEHNEAQLERLVGDAFREHGWGVSGASDRADPEVDLLVSGHGKKLVVEIKRAAEGRKDRVIPLLSQAALSAAYRSRMIPGHPLPVAIVGANRIPSVVAREAIEFVRKRAPEVAVGLLDWEGFRSFAGHGLESLNSPRHAGSSLRAPKQRPPQLFSDLNQWMLKVLLAPRIPEQYLSAPRGEYQGPSQLAEAAGVSVMSAFRFVEELSKESFLDSSLGGLRLVRIKELMHRWAAASQRRVLEIPVRWVLHRGKKALASALHSYESEVAAGLASPLSGSRPRLCVGLFEAAEELSVGFVHGVKPYLYVERLSAEVLKELGLSENVPEESADVRVRIPGNRESIFRGVVRKGGIPVSDILQVWLDVGQHPSRGKEQAERIWRKILAPALESSEP
jgi:restriction endonuclease